MPNSYEHSYQHDLDNVIDASNAVLAIGTKKVDTNTLKDKSLTGNDATIHGAMPSSGYFLGRTFDGDDDYLDCGNDSSLDLTNGTICVIFKYTNLLNGSIVIKDSYVGNIDGDLTFGNTSTISDGKLWLRLQDGSSSYTIKTDTLESNRMYFACASFGLNGMSLNIDGITQLDTNIFTGGMTNSSIPLTVGTNSSKNVPMNQVIAHIMVSAEFDCIGIFNTLACLLLYSHNFTQYPNSDTLLTTIFPYTSGQITSGSFNKTNGLKCTSAGTIVFSNNFEFDGSECITLTIDGVEYSGTTTVTQGTITASIAQGSNDITIEMGTNDVLEDIRVQFREEV